VKKLLPARRENGKRPLSDDDILKRLNVSTAKKEKVKGADFIRECVALSLKSEEAIAGKAVRREGRMSTNA
jgi:hypothetical protein